jgi:hypothetical protein
VGHGRQRRARPASRQRRDNWEGNEREDKEVCNNTRREGWV